MNRIKCFQCGLVNSNSDQFCRRCKTNLSEFEKIPPKITSTVQTKFDNASERSYLGSVIVLIIVVVIGGYFYTSLHPSFSKSQEEVEYEKLIKETNERRNKDAQKVTFDEGPCKTSNPHWMQCMKNRQEIEKMERLGRPQNR